MERASWNSIPVGVHMERTAACARAASPPWGRGDVAASDVAAHETAGGGRGVDGRCSGCDKAVATGDAAGTRLGMEAREQQQQLLLVVLQLLVVPIPVLQVLVSQVMVYVSLPADVAILWQVWAYGWKGIATGKAGTMLPCFPHSPATARLVLSGSGW